METVGKLLCTKELAERLGITPKAAAALLARNEIRGFKLSGKYWRTTELYYEFYVTRSVHKQAATKKSVKSCLRVA